MVIIVHFISLFQEFFRVDHATGIVTVARPLDREVAAIVRITVLVTDITAPSTQQGSGKFFLALSFSIN